MNDIRIINEKEYKTRFPNKDSFNIDDMDEELLKSYLINYSCYMYLFTKFLIKNTSLKYLDNEISNSNLKFIPIGNEQMDVYQILNNNLLKYFYIRNNIYLDRLSRDELYELESIILSNNTELNEMSEKFIKKTYKKLIFEKINGDEILSINFGPLSPRFLATNNSLIIGFRFDEFNTNNLDDKSWSILYKNQEEFLLKKINEEENNFINNLSMNVKIIKYNNFSIKSIEWN